MQTYAVTVGITPVAIPFTGVLVLGARLLARDGNGGDVYLGPRSDITISGSNVNLIPQGTPDASNTYVVAPGAYTGANTLYLVASTTNCIVDIVGA